MGNDNGKIAKALVIIAACAGVLALIAVEFAIAPSLGALWLIIALIVVAAAGFSAWTILHDLLHRGGRR